MQAIHSSIDAKLFGQSENGYSSYEEFNQTFVFAPSLNRKCEFLYAWFVHNPTGRLLFRLYYGETLFIPLMPNITDLTTKRFILTKVYADQEGVVGRPTKKKFGLQ